MKLDDLLLIDKMWVEFWNQIKGVKIKIKKQ